MIDGMDWLGLAIAEQHARPSIPKTLYLVVEDLALSYGYEIYVIGIFDSFFKADQVANEDPTKFRKMVEVKLNKEYTCSWNHEDYFGKSDIYLGGYVE